MTLSKPSLLFLPGSLCDPVLWAKQIAELFDVVQPIVADLTRDDTLLDMAERALSLVSGRFAVVGLSMGGYVAQEIIRLVPERVIGLGLFATSGRPETSEGAARRRSFIDLADTGDFDGVVKRLIPQLLYVEHLKDGDIVKSVQGMAERVGKDAFVRQLTAMSARPDGRLDLPKISCSTLVLCGTDDVITPPELHREIAAKIPKSTLIEISRCGHLPPIEQPDTVTAAMRDWIERLRAQP